MSVVYKATDTELNRPVALKFLAPHPLQDEEGRKRFRREAQAAAALDHPNICTVYEIGQADDQSFIAMAFLEGRPLSKKIGDGPLKLPEALSIAIQMAEGLEAAHEKGIVHRDIKPDNVMLMKGSRGLVKLMDFGLAQLAESSKLTREGTTLGTPIYMSPEQALGEPTDSRSDVWGTRRRSLRDGGRAATVPRRGRSSRHLCHCQRAARTADRPAHGSAKGA